jgi:ABC-type multidrug transport system fused ATPase/permease subunit
MHRIVVANLLHATSAYFESQPIGRIINRMSTDLDRVDVNLMNAIDGLLNAGGSMAASTIMIIVSALWTPLVMAPAVYLAYKVQSLYRVYVKLNPFLYEYKY